MPQAGGSRKQLISAFHHAQHLIDISQYKACLHLLIGCKPIRKLVERKDTVTVTALLFVVLFEQDVL